MYFYILNPDAYGGRGRRFKNKIHRYLKNLGIDGDFFESASSKETAKIVQTALKKGVDAIVAIGGDGIVNTIIQHIVKEHVALGIIPIGKTNLLARILRIHSWQQGCDNLVNKNTIDIDLGLINDRYFTSSAELYYDAYETKRLMNMVPIGKKQKYCPTILQIKSDGVKLKMQTNVSSVAISTIPMSGDFRAEDELINHKLHIFTKSKATVSKNNKKQERAPEISRLQASEVTIETKHPLNMLADGETIGKTPAHISILPKSLKVIVGQQNTSHKTK